MLKYVIEQDKILHNIDIIKKRAGSAKVYGVLKCGGYGMGVGRMARICSEGGLTHFAVTTAKEAAEIAETVPYEEILMLNPPSEDQLPLLLNLNVTFSVGSLEDIRLLVKLFDQTGKHPNAHIMIDTGMGRFGFYYSEYKTIQSLYSEYPEIYFTGIYTHLSDGYNQKKSLRQIARFEEVLYHLTAAGIRPGTRHCMNSSGLFFNDNYFDAVRIGTALFGRISSAEEFGLLPTGYCRADILSVKSFPKGRTIGYGSNYRTHQNCRVALCQIGTHNGLGLEKHPGQMTFSKKAVFLLRKFLRPQKMYAMISGIKCPILGAIGSETVSLDVSALSDLPLETAEFSVNPLLFHGGIITVA